MEFSDGKFVSVHFLSGRYGFFYETEDNDHQWIFDSEGEPIYFKEENDGKDIFVVNKLACGEENIFGISHCFLDEGENYYHRRFNCKFTAGELQQEDIENFFITDNVVQFPQDKDSGKSYVYNWQLNECFLIPNDKLGVVLDDDNKEWLETTIDITHGNVSDTITLYLDPQSFTANIAYSYLQDRIIKSEEPIKIFRENYSDANIEDNLIIQEEVVKYLDILNERENNEKKRAVQVLRKSFLEHL